MPRKLQKRQRIESNSIRNEGLNYNVVNPVKQIQFSSQATLHQEVGTEDCVVYSFVLDGLKENKRAQSVRSILFDDEIEISKDKLVLHESENRISAQLKKVDYEVEAKRRNGFWK
jgi:hypothetical protein